MKRTLSHTFLKTWVVAIGLFAVAGLFVGCSHDDPKKPAQFYDSGKEAQEKVIAGQQQAAYKKKMHDQHMPGY